MNAEFKFWNLFFGAKFTASHLSIGLAFPVQHGLSPAFHLVLLVFHVWVMWVLCCLASVSDLSRLRPCSFSCGFVLLTYDLWSAFLRACEN